MNPTYYEKYIKSSAWLKRKKKWFKKYGKWCRICDSKKVHLHHRTYDNFTQEKDEDLVALCEFCHTLVHQYHEESGLDLKEATDRCIKYNSKLSIRLKDKTPQQRPAPVIKSDFVPLNRRPGYKTPVLSGREGRLGGLPIKIISKS